MACVLKVSAAAVGSKMYSVAMSDKFKWRDLLPNRLR